MTFEQKDALNLRLERAIAQLDADFLHASSNAEKFYAYYQIARDNATNYHQQRILLLQAKQDLWSDDEEEF